MLRIPAAAWPILAGALLWSAGTDVARASEPPTALLNEWWQWSLSFPASVSPLLDHTGQRCTLGQRGPLWFLAGNTGGRTVRDCALPARGRVLIPLHNAICVPGAGDDTEQQCLERVLADWLSFTVAEATLDGVAQELIEQPPVPGESVFTFAIPRNGVFGFKPGLYRATIAAGRWAIVDLADPGVHTLRVRARSTSGVVHDVTYRLAVAEVN